MGAGEPGESGHGAARLWLECGPVVGAHFRRVAASCGRELAWGWFAARSGFIMPEPCIGRCAAAKEPAGTRAAGCAALGGYLR